MTKFQIIRNILISLTVGFPNIIKWYRVWYKNRDKKLLDFPHQVIDNVHLFYSDDLLMLLTCLPADLINGAARIIDGVQCIIVRDIEHCQKLPTNVHSWILQHELGHLTLHADYLTVPGIRLLSAESILRLMKDHPNAEHEANAFAIEQGTRPEDLLEGSRTLYAARSTWSKTYLALGGHYLFPMHNHMV